MERVSRKHAAAFDTVVEGSSIFALTSMFETSKVLIFWGALNIDFFFFLHFECHRLFSVFIKKVPQELKSSEGTLRKGRQRTIRVQKQKIFRHNTASIQPTGQLPRKPVGSYSSDPLTLFIRAIFLFVNVAADVGVLHPLVKFLELWGILGGKIISLILSCRNGRRRGYTLALSSGLLGRN